MRIIRTCNNEIININKVTLYKYFLFNKKYTIRAKIEESLVELFTDEDINKIEYVYETFIKWISDGKSNMFDFKIFNGE